MPEHVTPTSAVPPTAIKCSSSPPRGLAPASTAGTSLHILTDASLTALLKAGSGMFPMVGGKKAGAYTSMDLGRLCWMVAVLEGITAPVPLGPKSFATFMKMQGSKTRRIGGKRVTYAAMCCPRPLWLWDSLGGSFGHSGCRIFTCMIELRHMIASLPGVIAEIIAGVIGRDHRQGSSPGVIGRGHREGSSLGSSQEVIATGHRWVSSPGVIARGHR